MKFQAKVLPKSPTSIRGWTRLPEGVFQKGGLLLLWRWLWKDSFFAMEFLVRGATIYNEPGDLFLLKKLKRTNVKCCFIGFDLDTLVKAKKNLAEHIHMNAVKLNKAR